jgi:hypothetical protein
MVMIVSKWKNPPSPSSLAAERPLFFSPAPSLADRVTFFSPGLPTPIKISARADSVCIQSHHARAPPLVHALSARRVAATNRVSS